jgi:ABC-type bacteriocin/lantibiotic exporter with double-glycine peptidase domain
MLLPFITVLIEALSISHLNQSPFFSELARVKGYEQRPITGYEHIFKQDEQNTCGAAALAYLLTRLGNYVFEEDIISNYPRHAHEGYNALELSRIASDFGLKATVRRINWNELLGVGSLPIIAHFRTQHFVVLLKKTGNEITYFDPALGENVTISRPDFARKWSGIGIVFTYRNSAHELNNYGYSLNH